MSLQPLDELPKTPLKINRALISVADKTGITELAKKLHAANVEIISTGGTARAIRQADIPVIDVAECTGEEEMLDGRVKTLHPVIHGGILGRTSHQPDVDEMKRLNIAPFELVVGNLYPFEETIQKEHCTPALATENIDIGGPTMLRAAAKNFAHVCVLSRPQQYKPFINQLEAGSGITFEYRRQWARQAFEHTAAYDAHIANYFTSIDETDGMPEQLTVALPRSQALRYGENPHQQAAVYGNQRAFIDCFHGKQLSYNNLIDIDGALAFMADFAGQKPACGIFKHTVPCGAATANKLHQAWDKAFATDTSSPYGGIIIVNKKMDLETAKKIDAIFTEIILAPSFTDDARELLQQKKNRRLVRIKKYRDDNSTGEFRSIFGGAVSQQADVKPINVDDYEIVTERQPTNKEMEDLIFAWKVVKHVKSNGIVYARDGQTIGIGTGQTSRIESSKIAIAKATDEGLSIKNTALASDAFFPFADGLVAAAKAGATAVIQPGGSIRDDEVIAAANEHNIAMVCTGNRHFRH